MLCPAARESSTCLVRNGDDAVLGDHARAFWQDEDSGDRGLDIIDCQTAEYEGRFKNSQLV